MGKKAAETLTKLGELKIPIEREIDPWKEAVIDECVTANIGWDENDPRKSLKNVIDWNVQVALDPLVSKPAADAKAPERADILMLILQHHIDLHFVTDKGLVAAFASHDTVWEKAKIEDHHDSWEEAIAYVVAKVVSDLEDEL